VIAQTLPPDSPELAATALTAFRERSGELVAQLHGGGR
jgi:hypothetical protein